MLKSILDNRCKQVQGVDGEKTIDYNPFKVTNKGVDM